MKEVKVVELLPDGLTKVELPDNSDNARRLSKFKVRMLEMVLGERQAYEELQRSMPGMVKYCSYQPTAHQL